MDIEGLVSQLKNYDGREITLMEVCGSHTAAISKNGIKSILSDKIKLISGPGCPVCVTPTAYVDKLIELAYEENTTVVTFGDLLRVPGSKESLQQAVSKGASVKMVYSPMDTLALAVENPGTMYIFAAVGFETTTPVYAMLLSQIERQGIKNLKLLTSIKSMPQVICSLLEEGCEIDGFIAPGHVCAVTGYDIFEPIAKEYNIPFSVCGFEGEELVFGIYALVQMVLRGDYSVKNCYKSVVDKTANSDMTALVDKYFVSGEASWRGMGVIEGSGKWLRDSYKEYDAGSRGLNEDNKKNKACACGEILKGKAKPDDCPLFNKACTPDNPQGACMVSYEGGCATRYKEVNS